MLQGAPGTAERAKALRGAMSLPDVLLWRVLRQRPGGLKFRRQHPAGRYVADFCCHEARLIVEVDGEAHNCGDRPRRDQTRDAWFSARELSVLRLPAAYILQDLDAAIRAVVATATLHRPAGGPPPHAMRGEELHGAP